MRWTPEKITVAKYRIVLNPPDAPPIHSAPYLAGPEQRGLEREEVAQMKKADVASPAVSKWASLIVLVPMKDGSLPIYVDCR